MHLEALEEALVRAVFEPAYYRKRAGLAPENDFDADALFQHYLNAGIANDIAPSLFFDPAMARRIASVPDDTPAMIGWLRARHACVEGPTPFFDADHYLAANPDLVALPGSLFEHYMLHGIRENRVPNALFDAAWYHDAYKRPAGDAKAGGNRDYSHFLHHGIDAGHAPSRLLLAAFATDSGAASPGIDDFLSLANAARRLSAQLGPERIAVLFAFFTPQFHDAGGRLPADAGNLARLIDFLEHGLDDGAAPGPLFDRATYAASLGEAAGAEGRDDTFRDYLLHGWARRVVPTAIYSDDAYLSINLDVRQAGIWGFWHFLMHGIYEGRRLKGQRKLSLAQGAADPASISLTNWRMFWVASGIPGAESSGVPALAAAQQQRLNAFTRSPLFGEIVARARALDPSLGDTFAVDGYYAAPWHDIAAQMWQRLHARIPAATYGTVITVPWLRLGGADLVACQLASAVRKVRPGERVLLLRTDWPHFERPDWVPTDVDMVDISDILDEYPPAAEHLLYALFKSLDARRVINVNSARTWQMFKRFGKRLGEHMDLYSYLFCWDQTEEGVRVGYPSMFYSACIGQVSGIFTDTDYLRDELLRIYRPPPELARRTLSLYTPARTTWNRPAIAETSFISRRARRPRVLWAGRLDRQKRFDLVVAIATAMPDIDFLCWGAAVLDSPPGLETLPPNLTLNDSFKTYDELPMEDADAWLFTSAWEGMPTIVIEIAIRGMAVIASQVGGIPELVDGETGFPVHDIDNVDAYVAALRSALGDPLGRIARARRLQKRVARRYGEAQYVDAIAGIFDQETLKCRQ